MQITRVKFAFVLFQVSGNQGDDNWSVTARILYYAKVFERKRETNKDPSYHRHDKRAEKVIDPKIIHKNLHCIS